MAQLYTANIANLKKCYALEWYEQTQSSLFKREKCFAVISLAQSKKTWFNFIGVCVEILPFQKDRE